MQECVIPGNLTTKNLLGLYCTIFLKLLQVSAKMIPGFIHSVDLPIYYYDQFIEGDTSL